MTLDGQTVFRESFANAAPEPATWALLLAGLGVVGAPAWRRKATSLSEAC